MIDLEKQSGLPIVLDGEIIKPKEGFDLPIPAFRKLEELASVLMEGSELTGPEICYTMFPRTSKSKDKALFQKHNLRYDMTIVLAGSVGQEFIKTIGHYHSKKPGTDIYYPEIYEVIHGRAQYIIQKVDNNEVVDVKIIEAVEGEKVVVPPGYGHITINPGKETLVEANIQPDDQVASYTEYAVMHGACFYELSDGGFVKNENYQNDFEPKVIKANIAKNMFGTNNGVPMYTDFIVNPEKYDFLANPEKYLEKFGQIY